MNKLLYLWRYYTLEKEQYYECMNKVCKDNLFNIRLANSLVVFLTCAFACYTIFIQNNIKNAFICLFTALIGLLLVVLTSFYIKLVNSRKKQINKKNINLLIIIYYVNIIFYGLYINVWSYRENHAVIFMILLLCALLLFYNSPLLNLCLTLVAAATFIIFSILLKSPEIFIPDICSAVFSALISLIVCWRVTMLRFVSDLSVLKIEKERNRYFEESTIDELTQLRNRRDFMRTFHRYLVNYRATDHYLCIAIADVDSFKSFNDLYGHPKGDDCLRAIGGTLKGLRETMGVYCARVGGEEFAFLWFEKDIPHVDTVVSHINKLIRSLKIPHEKSNVSEYITMSIGVYIEECGASADTENLYNLADKALYSAKESGRNCSIIRGRDVKEYRLDPEKD